MTNTPITEDELRSRLAGKLSPEKIDALIEGYVEASSKVLPNMELIKALAERRQASEYTFRRVSFTLDEDQYRALASYFGESETSPTILVKKALQEFVQLMS